MKALNAAFAALVLCWLSANAQPQIYSFVTIAGDSSVGSANGTNSDARFDIPGGIALDGAGNIFVADNQTIRKLTPVGTNWVSSTIAGLPGRQGSADGMNSAARFSSPFGIAVDRDGNLFVADSQNLTIRKLTLAGTNWVSSTIAGLVGTRGSADGTNNDVRFSWPISVAVDRAGDVFVADDHRLRKLSHLGTNWVSSTIPIGFYEVIGVAFDSIGELYVTGAYFIGNDGDYGVIARLKQLGTNWMGESVPLPPEGHHGFFQITAGMEGRVLVTTPNSTIWQGWQTGTDWVWTKAAGQAGQPGSTDGTNDAALFNGPFGLAANSAGELYVTDSGNNNTVQIQPEQIGSILAPALLQLTKPFRPQIPSDQ